MVYIWFNECSETISNLFQNNNLFRFFSIDARQFFEISIHRSVDEGHAVESKVEFLNFRNERKMEKAPKFIPYQPELRSSLPSTSCPTSRLFRRISDARGRPGRLIHGPAGEPGIRTDKVVKSGEKKRERWKQRSRRRVECCTPLPSPLLEDRGRGIRVRWLADILITDWPRGLIKS